MSRLTVLNRREPVRFNVYVVAVMLGVIAFLEEMVESGDPLRATLQTFIVMVPVVGGAEVARSHAYAPDTVDALLQLERAGRGAETPEAMRELRRRADDPPGEGAPPFDVDV